MRRTGEQASFHFLTGTRQGVFSRVLIECRGWRRTGPEKKKRMLLEPVGLPIDSAHLSEDIAWLHSISFTHRFGDLHLRFLARCRQVLFSDTG